MPYLKNVAFTSLIKINGRLREFNFRKRSEALYDGDTNDERGDRYFFKVELENQNWRVISSGLPFWLTEYEAAIIEAVQKQEPQTSRIATAVAKK